LNNTAPINCRVCGGVLVRLEGTAMFFCLKCPADSDTTYIEPEKKKKRKSGYLSTKSDKEEGTIKRKFGRGSGRRFGSTKKKR